MVEKEPLLYPNKYVPEEEIFHDKDFMNKEYFYAKLAQRLGYSRAYDLRNSKLEVNLADQSLVEYDKDDLKNRTANLKISDSNLNAEIINFKKLDQEIEARNHKRY